MDVNRDSPDQFYQPTTRVDVEQVDGRWYLAAPLLPDYLSLRNSELDAEVPSKPKCSRSVLSR